MRDRLLSCERRVRMPIWAVSRGRLRPDGKIYYVPVGNWRAWTKDEAIKLAAHAIRGIAVLKAVMVRNEHRGD